MNIYSMYIYYLLFIILLKYFYVIIEIYNIYMYTKSHK